MWASMGNTAAPITSSDVEENRLVVALHANVEAIDWLGTARLLVGNKATAAIVRRAPGAADR
jgi:hypothetical protein